MTHIGIIGSKDYVNYLNIIKLLLELREELGVENFTIYTTGKRGAEEYAKRYALEMGIRYGEYNPSYTGYNMYSVLPPSYYGKNRHPSHQWAAYNALVKRCNKVFVYDVKGDDTFKTIKNTLIKTNKLIVHEDRIAEVIRNTTKEKKKNTIVERRP